MTPGPGIEPGTHWWEPSALTTAPPLLPVKDLRKTEKNSWRRPQKSNLERAGEELFESGELGQPTVWILSRYRRLGSTSVSFLEDGDQKASDSWHAKWFLYEKLHKGLNTTNWREVSLVSCRLQKIIDAEDESDAKIFSVPGSERFPVKMLKNCLGHLNPTSDALFLRPRDGQSKKFNPADDNGPRRK